ncbi:MAG: OadG family protein [Tenericutes bacterium]|nr:OadG family protein [Mycoplasmatota bacterium]
MMILISTLEEGLLISLFSVMIVFLILGFIALSIQSLKYFQAKPKQVLPVTEESDSIPFNFSDIKDEQMMVAALVASIDYYEKIKKDVRVVSVKEITVS